MESRHKQILFITKGLCSLWIVYYHLLSATQIIPFPRLNARFFEVLWDHGQSWGTLIHSTFAAMSIHAVGVFIILSGYGLTRSLLKMKKNQEEGFWKKWYISRGSRVYPLYWYSHLIFLFFPFVAQLEPIDWRFLLSFTGIQVWPMDSIFFYANPSWWFIWLIIQLYAFYPALFHLLNRLGRWNFLFLALGVGFLARYLVLIAFPSANSGMLCMGGLFLCRLGEFAIGMFLAAAITQETGKKQGSFFSGLSLDSLLGLRGFLAGCMIYLIGLCCYASLASYVFVDTISSLGFMMIILNMSALFEKVPVVRPSVFFAGTVSFGMYLLHQPFALTLGNLLEGASMTEFYASFLLFLGFMLAFAWASQEIVEMTVKKSALATDWMGSIFSRIANQSPIKAQK